MSNENRAPALLHRVGALEARMATVEARLDALADLPAQMAELTVLIKSALSQQQERVDHLDAQLIDATEQLQRDVREVGSDLRALTRVIEGRPCLAGGNCGPAEDSRGSARG